MPPRTYKPSQLTKTHILQTAVERYNESGTASVPMSALAEACGISAGNLQYHYRNKEEVIRAILEDLFNEYDVIYAQPNAPFTLDSLRILMRLGFDITWKYRFFFRELGALLRHDPLLAARFREIQEQRLEDQKIFIRQLAEANCVPLPLSPEELHRITLVGWVLANTWLSYVESLGQEINDTTLNEAVEVMVQHYKPYFPEIL
ncbi:MAG TPA: TetR/AcrR family transcriptional regulator [Anaerolineales bacterium]|nr:TetR/AcrR family transcriptional regulator [Anaerolineales bacterium]